MDEMICGLPPSKYSWQSGFLDHRFVHSDETRVEVTSNTVHGHSSWWWLVMLLLEYFIFGIHFFFNFFNQVQWIYFHSLEWGTCDSKWGLKVNFTSALTLWAVESGERRRESNWNFARKDNFWKEVFERKEEVGSNLLVIKGATEWICRRVFDHDFREKDMVKNIDSLSITGSGEKTQNERFRLKEGRKEIETTHSRSSRVLFTLTTYQSIHEPAVERSLQKVACSFFVCVNRQTKTRVLCLHQKIVIIWGS